MNNYIFNIIILIIIIYIFFRLSLNKESYFNDVPKIAWTYWDDMDTIPDSVTKILNKRKEVLIGWNSIVLNKNNINEYIDPHEFPNNYDYLMPAHKSDWIRLCLLKKYGGLWLDAGIIINSIDALNQMYDESIKLDSELSVFYLESNMINNDPMTYIENWYILAPANSRIINAWYNEFTSAIKMDFINYKNELINLGIKIDQVIGGEGNTYLTMHAALQKIIQLNLINNPRIILYKAEDSMFKIQHMCNWNKSCVIDKLINDGETKNIPYIKLRGMDRQ